jgi:hypothetical protein
MSFFAIARRLIALAATKSIRTNALWVSFLVGSALNAINQGDEILGAGPVSWPHLFLNYAVPFCVASFSAARHQLKIDLEAISARGMGGDHARLDTSSNEK